MSDEKGVGLKGWLSGQKSKRTQPGSQAEAVVLEKYRVAVLPLANFTPDPKEEYFADGMTEELISALANVSGLQVISRTSVMQYKNTSRKVVDIGRDLGAGSIIEGSVRKAGDRLRISVQLIDAQADKHLWAQTYDRDLKDVFALQSDIARNVSEALKLRLLPEKTVQPEKRTTSNMEAYTLCLKGRYHWNKRTKESNEKALECFQSAIEQDPEYALAYSGLADCYNVAADYGFMPAGEAYSKARQASQKALELDPNLGEAHAALGWVLTADWDWTGAEREHRRAIELSPNYASGRQWYSILLLVQGRRDEALIEAKKACELDPLSPRILCYLGEVHYELGDFDSALTQFGKVLELQPDFVSALGDVISIYAERGMCEEALRDSKKIDLLLHSDAQSKLCYAWVYAHCGREDEAREILRESRKNLGDDHIFIIAVAGIYAKLRDRNEAMEVLEKAYAAHNYGLMSIFGNEFANLRSDPRFVELQRKIGLRR